MSGKPILSYAAAALILAAGTILPVAAQAMQAVNLRCEYAANPLGIDAVRPRLSWTLASKRRGERQTAYQILVADSPNALKRNQGDFWDSGKVASDESAQIDYAGKPLASRQRVWWKVRVWDRDGKPSAYTAPRWWEAGLLKPEDWKGNWIGRLGNAADRPRPERRFVGVVSRRRSDSGSACKRYSLFPGRSRCSCESPNGLCDALRGGR